MRVNPGGQLEVESIVGRDELIAQMWEILSGRSIYMNDLRRIGKTQIMVKMAAEPPAGWTTIKRDLGGFHAAAEFATKAYRDSNQALGAKKKSLRTMSDLLARCSGLEIGSVIKFPNGETAPWKEVLSRIFSDLNEAMIELGPNHRILFLWDEVPFLLDNISKREGHQVAMEVLDVLRSLGQDYDRVRLLLTGSIGLHHILGELRQKGYNNSPLNRMAGVRPGPLAEVDAILLARGLVEGASIKCDDIELCATALARSVGHVPFYIHKLVSCLPKQKLLNSGEIERILIREITSEQSDWDLIHYRNRLSAYYGNDERLALRVLDAVAAGERMTFGAIRREVSVGMPNGDDQQLLALMSLLCLDHYLEKTEDNHYRFYLGLIRRWWCINRSL